LPKPLLAETADQLTANNVNEYNTGDCSGTNRGDRRRQSSFCKPTLPLVIPKPGLSARNLLAAGSEAADSSRENAALRNDKAPGIFKLETTRSQREHRLASLG
jgi:hypothetical protein